MTRTALLMILMSLLVWSLPFVQLSAQCSGTTTNIIAGGDFGSGVANILPDDPGLAPGYLYTTNPPPNDGLYCITNNTTEWGAFAAEFWIDIGDNSPDPFGYMMVVNCDFDPGIFFEQEVTDLCENTTYAFSADIINVNIQDNVIRPNVSFLMDNEVVYSTGQIPATGQWNTFGFTFVTAPGQSTIQLSLTNNASGGIGNDLALDNIFFRPCGPDAALSPAGTEVICQDENPFLMEVQTSVNNADTLYVRWEVSYDEGGNWEAIENANGFSFEHSNTVAGTYWYRFIMAYLEEDLDNPICRVVSTIKIIEVVPHTFPVFERVCEGNVYVFGNDTLTETGFYTDSLLNQDGCDSIVWLDLRVESDRDIQTALTLQDPSCHDFGDGSIGIDSVWNGQAPFVYLVNEDTLTGDFLEGLPFGKYGMSIVDAFGCRLDTAITLGNPNEITIDIDETYTVELGASIHLQPAISEPLFDFEWQYQSQTICVDDCGDIDLLPDSSGWVVVQAWNADGCLTRDSAYVEVLPIRQVYIPNAFSPNADGLNDHFAVFASQPNVQSIESFTIYNRWGAVVFHQANILPNDLTNGWDGRFQGAPCNTGIYIYSADIRFLDGAILNYSGDVLLVRP